MQSEIQAWQVGSDLRPSRQRLIRVALYAHGALTRVAAPPLCARARARNGASVRHHVCTIVHGLTHHLQGLLEQIRCDLQSGDAATARSPARPRGVAPAVHEQDGAAGAPLQNHTNALRYEVLCRAGSGAQWIHASAHRKRPLVTPFGRGPGATSNEPSRALTARAAFQTPARCCRRPHAPGPASGAPKCRFQHPARVGAATHARG